MSPGFSTFSPECRHEIVVAFSFQPAKTKKESRCIEELHDFNNRLLCLTLLLVNLSAQLLSLYVAATPTSAPCEFFLSALFLCQLSVCFACYCFSEDKKRKRKVK